MAYIGVSPSNGVRRKHTYTATANQTSFSGAGAEGATLSYNDSNFVDVYQNGVKLSEADYTSTSGTAIVLAQGASVSDIVEIVVYDVFSVADTVSKADGGTFDGAVTLAGGVSGNIANVSGDMTIDVAGDIILDADGAQIRLSDNGTQFGLFGNESSDFAIQSSVQDKDILFQGNDGGSGITALTLDMSADGHATFKNGVTLTDGNLVVASGHGIDFSATGNVSGTSSELLDDYEEGTWTPGFSGNIAFSTAANFTYTKIGRVVHTTGYLSGKSGTFGTGWNVTGLPFAGNANYNLVPLWSHGGGFSFHGYVNGNASVLNIRDRDSANMNNISEIGIHFTYTTT